MLLAYQLSTSQEGTEATFAPVSPGLPEVLRMQQPENLRKAHVGSKDVRLVNAGRRDFCHLVFETMDEALDEIGFEIAWCRECLPHLPLPLLETHGSS